MMESTHTNYAPPVDQLLTYGEGKISKPENWPNYLESGPGPEHIPDLIRMAADEELNGQTVAQEKSSTVGGQDNRQEKTTT